MLAMKKLDMAVIAGDQLRNHDKQINMMFARSPHVYICQYTHDDVEWEVYYIPASIGDTARLLRQSESRVCNDNFGWMQLAHNPKKIVWPGKWTDLYKYAYHVGQELGIIP